MGKWLEALKSCNEGPAKAEERGTEASTGAGENFTDSCHDKLTKLTKGMDVPEIPPEILSGAYVSGRRAPASLAWTPGDAALNTWFRGALASGSLRQETAGVDATPDLFNPSWPPAGWIVTLPCLDHPGVGCWIARRVGTTEPEGHGETQAEAVLRLADLEANR